MPIIKSAKKALRQTIKRTAKNRATKQNLKIALKKVSTGKLAKVQALIDKAVKNHLIHKNKAARLKSQLFKKFGSPIKVSHQVKTRKK